MKAPDFALKNADEQIITLQEFLGKKVVLYFYPRDNTPGCTKEACSFRDVYADILQAGAAVIGISPDSAASHAKFRDKYSLPFHLLSDQDHEVAKSYGAWEGKILRKTFIIDEQGNIIREFPKVSPADHGPEILRELAHNGAK